MNHPLPNCTTIEHVQAFEALAIAFSEQVGAGVAFTSAPMPDGRIRHTATHEHLPGDMAHDYLPPDAGVEAIERTRQGLATRMANLARIRIDTPEAKAARESIKKSHAKVERIRLTEQAKADAIARAAEARSRVGQHINGPGLANPQ